MIQFFIQPIKSRSCRFCHACYGGLPTSWFYAVDEISQIRSSFYSQAVSCQSSPKTKSHGMTFLVSWEKKSPSAGGRSATIFCHVSLANHLPLVRIFQFLKSYVMEFPLGADSVRLPPLGWLA